jgi:hypothetical protein
MTTTGYTIDYSPAQLHEFAVERARVAVTRAQRALDRELAHGRACADESLVRQFRAWLSDAETDLRVLLLATR